MSVLPFKNPENSGDTPPKPPAMFNIPPFTLALMAAMAAVHVAVHYGPDVFSDYGLFLAFIPARYTTTGAFDAWAAVAPVTHLFLHGSLFHLLMNGVMLMAFGAAAERMMGAKRAALLFFICGLGGALAQFLLDPSSTIPMIGASGALSGLFAATIIRLQETGAMPAGRFGIWGIAALWVGVSLLFGLAGGAVGVGNVAWAAHAGGFLTGIAAMRLRVFRAGY